MLRLLRKYFKWLDENNPGWAGELFLSVLFLVIIIIVMLTTEVK